MPPRAYSCWWLPLTVILSTGGGVCPSACWDTPSPRADTPWQTPPRADTPPQADTPPPPADGYCCGRYASYWNAFFLIVQMVRRITLMDSPSYVLRLRKMAEEEQHQQRLVTAWHTSFKKGTDYDLWGQPVEATSEYHRSQFLLSE